MQTQDAIKLRRSVRNFQAKPIAKDDIIKLIAAAHLAPTARNIQPWEFIVISNKDTREKIASLAENGRFISQAPVCVAVLCKDTKYYLEDGCAATVNLMLSATDLGIDSCWVAGDKKPYCQEIKQILNVGEDFKLVSLVALGYKRDNVSAPRKRDLNELIHWEKF